MHEMSWLSLWTYHAAAATAVITAESNFKNSNQWADDVTLCVVEYNVACYGSGCGGYDNNSACKFLHTTTCIGF